MEIIKKSEGISPYIIECGPNGRCDGQCSSKSSQCTCKTDDNCRMLVQFPKL